jgi:hypothetical protein
MISRYNTCTASASRKNVVVIGFSMLNKGLSELSKFWPMVDHSRYIKLSKGVICDAQNYLGNHTVVQNSTNQLLSRMRDWLIQTGLHDTISVMYKNKAALTSVVA